MMKIFGKDHDYRAHFRWPSRREIALATLGLLLVSMLHSLSFFYGDAFWQAITLRLYYLPVIYGAVRSGMILGFASGSLAALTHYIVTQLPMQHEYAHNTALQIEHTEEIPFLILLGLITGAIRDHEKQEREQKNRISEQFGNYVSAEVRDDILKGNVQLGGNEVEITVLFADIRNFTSFSENHTAIEVVELLNQYFTEMVRAITQHGGIVNKFIGDAIMGVFGAPRHSENHAEQAVLVALEMLQRLKAHNYLQTTKGQATFEIGIGINTGFAIAGNIGAENRKEYTVIGDPVNLASRIESLTKSYGVPLLIADSVKARIETEKFILREIDTVTVKGRHKPCTVFEVLDFNNTKE